MSIEDMKRALTKHAELLSSNEDRRTPAQRPLHPDPPGYVPELLGGIEYSSAVLEEADLGRRVLLHNAFSNVEHAANADKAFMRQHFDHFGGSTTTSHSPLLQKTAELVPDEGSLTDRVNRVLRRP